MVYVWMAVGIALAVAFIVIGSVFFGLKPGPSTTTNSNYEPIDASQYAPKRCHDRYGKTAAISQEVFKRAEC